MSGGRGFAVIDTETTGILTGFRHRIAEIAVVQVDDDGTVTDEWCTLVNPDRDLGPQHIHGISAAEVRRAPRFEQIAGDLVARLRGRVVVAHNWSFDAMHLRAEFARIGLDTPFGADGGLCTMAAAGLALPGSGRSLQDCCASAGLVGRRWHTARDDALGAAALLGYLLTAAPWAVEPTAEHLAAARWDWPAMPCDTVACVHRTPAGWVEPHFLARLVERIPRDEEPIVDAYFALLDDALLDRRISAAEADGLVDVACELGLVKPDVLTVHNSYLRELTRAALADGVVTETERADLDAVAALLGLDATVTSRVLAEERVVCPEPVREVAVGGLVLRPGDRIVLTGEMRHQRDDLVDQAVGAGLRVTSSVSKKTRVLVAADPDSLSGKAKTARALGVPVVNEDAFLRAMAAMP